MPNLSLPLINSLLLALLWLQVFSRRRQMPVAPGALAFIATCALCTLLVGLRWGGDFPPAAYLQPLVAATLPAMCWYCLRAPRRKDPTHSPGFHYAYLLPIIITGLSMVSGKMLPWPLLDLTLIALYLGYGAALICSAWRRETTPGISGGRRLNRTGHRYAGAGALLMLSGALDIAVALDFGLDRGARAVYLVGGANLLTLVVLAAIIARSGNSMDGEAPADLRPHHHAIDQHQPDDAVAPTPAPDDYHRAGQFERLMREERLYTDPDLSILKLSKRLGLPVRQLSGAINLVHGRNISQLINEYRINEAIRLLDASDDKITEIMLASGFQTKSNFNREFRRVAGINPSEYRRMSVQPGVRVRREPGNF